MHNAFWNSFVIKMLNLLEENRILKQYRSAFPGSQRVLIIGNNCARLCSSGDMHPGGLVQFSSSPDHFLSFLNIFAD